LFCLEASYRFYQTDSEENNYSGFLPNFFTVEDLINTIADKQPIQGIPPGSFHLMSTEA
jgi:hypothetical protein